MTTRTICTLFILILPLIIFSCSVDSYSTGENSLNNEETVLAGQILGESISENQSGLLSVFGEAFAVPGSTNLEPVTYSLAPISIRKVEEYVHQFHEETGEHHVTFIRTETIGNTESVISYELIYTFFDSNNRIIEFPANRSGEIDAVDYRATRSGEITDSLKTSLFSRSDHLFIDGLSAETPFLTIDGYHSGEGSFSRTGNTGQAIQREYLLDINYLDIRINKSTVQQNRNFRKGVNGALSYETVINQAGTGETKIVNGTIELNGDGTALLRFRDQFDTFRLRLENGEVFDEDEFEGRVVNTDLDQQIFTLSNGQRIQVNHQTEFEDGDFNTLEEVAAAVSFGVRIIAEGDYFHPDESVNLWIATEVEFELESDEFEDLVQALDTDLMTFTLTNGDLFFLTESSEINFEDGVSTLQEVADAARLGMPVEADGEFYVESETGRRIVKEVEFEIEFDEFEDYVNSADTPKSTFTLRNGREIKINEDTVINSDGDFLTLQEVADALASGIEVEAEGEYYFSSPQGIWMAVTVEFED